MHRSASIHCYVKMENVPFFLKGHVTKWMKDLKCAILLLGIYSEEIIGPGLKDECTRTVTAALFIVANNVNNLDIQIKTVWLNELEKIHSPKHYVTHKNNVVE